MSKDNDGCSTDMKSNKKCIQIKGATTTTTSPASFSSPVNRTVMKGKRGRRGGGGKAGTHTRTTIASEALGFMDVEEEIHSGDEKENEGVMKLSTSQKTAILKPKTETRGRRGRGRKAVQESKVDDGVREDNCGARVGFSHEQMSHGEVCVVNGENSSQQVELSPITDQLGKLSLHRKSVSPVKRKSGGGVSETTVMLGSGDVDVTETNDDDGNEEIKAARVSIRGRTGRGRGGRGRTSGRSAVVPRSKKCQLTNGEKNTISNDLIDKENCLPDEISAVELDESPKVTVKRKTKSSVANKSSTAKSNVAEKSTRRNTRRNQKVNEEQQEQIDEALEEDLPEVQRGDDNVKCDRSFSSLQSPMHQFTVDTLNATPTASPNFQDFNEFNTPSLDEMPMSPDNANISYNFDIFSTPLRELRLNSPIEIPRGRPQRKTVTEKQLQPNSPNMETPRGFGDDNDNDQENALVSPLLGNRLGKSSKSRLSLKKNTKKTTTAMAVLCESSERANSELPASDNDKKANEVELDKNEIVIKSGVDGEKWSIDKMEVKGKIGVVKMKGSRAGKRKPVGEGKGLLQHTGLKEEESLSKCASTPTRRCGKAMSVSQPEGREHFETSPSNFSTSRDVIGDGLLEEAVESLRQLSAFPPSHIFNQLSKATALTLLGCHSAHNTVSQTRIAAHLTNSMHVTFQHMLNKNLVSKIRVKKTSEESINTTTRKTENENISREEFEREREVMKEVLDNSLLQWSVEESLAASLENLPQGWVVVQMAVVSLDLFQQRTSPCQVLITRMSSDSPPMTFRIPLDRWKDFSRAKRVMDASIVHNVEGMTPEKYWTYRYKNDQDMKNLLYFLQEKFLSGHKWLLTGRLKELNSNRQLAAKLHQAAVSLGSRMKQAGGDEAMDLACLKAILEMLLFANEKDIQSLLGTMWPNQEVICSLVQATVLAVQKELVPLLKAEDGDGKEGKRKKDAGDEEGVMGREPVVLILDKQFSQISWESMPVLKSECISRVPSLAALQALLRLHQHRSDSVFRRGVGRRNVMTVIDPETNLENSVKLLQPQYEKYEGWKCQTQQALTVDALKEYLSQELYIYSGHGWGRQFVAGDELQMFRAKAVAIIMGCNSGRMEYGRMTDGHGPPLYFLLAGCPAVIGNLWVVTDKDIDKLTSRLCQAWMTSRGQKSLGRLLNDARQSCKLVGLNGFAPVIYGLPIQMN